MRKFIILFLIFVGVSPVFASNNIEDIASTYHINPTMTEYILEKESNIILASFGSGSGTSISIRSKGFSVYGNEFSKAKIINNSSHDIKVNGNIVKENSSIYTWRTWIDIKPVDNARLSYSWKIVGTILWLTIKD